MGHWQVTGPDGTRFYLFEAPDFVAWRDAVWTYAYAELAKVEGGQRPQPTVDAIILELPGMAWPAGYVCRPLTGGSLASGRQ